MADESADAGAEVTEEEWNRRVAELNKHQVGGLAPPPRSSPWLLPLAPPLTPPPLSLGLTH